MNRALQIERLENRVQMQPGDMPAVKRLVTLLEMQPGETGRAGRFGTVQAEIRKTLRPGWQEALADPARTHAHYSRWVGLLTTAGVLRVPPVGQIFSGRAMTINGIHAHCGERLKFFAETGAISRLCHDCYKVQILPESVAALFQTYFLLLSLDLPGDNARKCMIELRDGIKYPYKAYIYCQSIPEARACLEAFRQAQSKANVTGVSSKISHGCSEYGAKYPDFKFSDADDVAAFQTPPDWADVEKQYFSKRDLPTPGRTTNTRPDISLRDVCAFRTWVEYGQIIGDPSSTGFARAAPELPPAFVKRVRAQARIRNREMAELAPQA